MNNSKYKNAVFYVLSGTGNTYRMACWMKEVLSRYKISTKIIMIEDADFDQDFKPSSGVLVGTLFPAHGFMPPWSMIKFLFKLPKRKAVSAICAATRGAYRLGPVTIPGASGFATFFAAIIMFLKGFRVRAIFSLDMPANLINFHWGPHPKNVLKISNRSKDILAMLLPRILQGRKIVFTRNNLWESLWCTLLIWLIPLFPILYLIIARMFMAKVMFTNNRCVGCGVCARSCPNNAILMKKDIIASKNRPYWTYHCENCLRCMAYCHKKAVEAGHSWAILLYFITSVPVLAFILKWLQRPGRLLPDGLLPGSFLSMINHDGIVALLNVIYFLPALMLSYWIFWHLIRLPPVNTFFSVTNLTHYYRRYHHPEARLKDLINKKGKRTDR